MGVVNHQRDLELIALIKVGDGTAFAELVDLHKQYAFTLAFRILGNREESEEVAQDAFVKAFGALDTFKGVSRFSTWFYRIVYNAAVSQMRKRKTHGELNHQEVEAKVMDSDMHLLESSDRRRYVSQAIGRLQPQDGTIISLFYLKEFSLDEIGEITGINPNTVKVKLYRARRRLADELRKVLKDEVNSLL